MLISNNILIQAPLENSQIFFQNLDLKIRKINEYLNITASRFHSNPIEDKIQIFLLDGQKTNHQYFSIQSLKNTCKK